MNTIVAEVWSKSKLLIKAFIIGILTLFLLIPTYHVQGLIEEREARQKEAIAEVSQKWAGKQTIAGPMLVLPYTQTSVDTSKKTTVIKHYAYCLPSELTINSTIIPQEKHRGIYKVILYSAQVNLSGSFDNAVLEQLKIPASQILWNEAFLQLNMTNLRGLNEEMKLRWKNTTLALTPDLPAAVYHSQTLAAPLPISNAGDLKEATFSGQISLNGAEQLMFVPVGRNTAVHVQSRWPDPSFAGSLLPQSTTVNDSGFTATWKSLSYNRDFPQQFKDSELSFNQLSSAAFGVNLYVPVNAYQKTMRSIKYAILCIVLTFTGFFLIETVNKTAVHPFQYGLIGLALVLFYTLLLSFAEYIGFNAAYGIASVCIIGLVGWFVNGILNSNRLSLLLSVVILLLYSYVFTLLQLQDYALLLGSVGLFLTLAVVMYFSRKIQW